MQNLFPRHRLGQTRIDDLSVADHLLAVDEQQRMKHYSNRCTRALDVEVRQAVLRLYMLVTDHPLHVWPSLTPIADIGLMDHQPERVRSLCWDNV